MLMSRPIVRMLAAAAVAIGCGGRSASTLSPDGGAQQNTWFTTCGDPAVNGNPDAGHRPSALPACTTEREGASCAVANAECDPNDNANRYLLCTATDPKQAPGGCPISRAKYKKDIHFLAEEDLEPYRDQLLSLPLATWRYRDSKAGSRLHLGFMIDGHESLVCVEPERDQVDLYGYTSMAVAALKVQARQIEELQKEVAALRAALPASRRVARAAK